MTYEYICEACGHAWEAQQPISADPLRDCPRCNAPRAKRQISLGGGFILKGGGWYSDLYSSTPAGDSAKSGDGKDGAKPKETRKEASPAKESGAASGKSTDKPSGGTGKASGSSGGASAGAATGS